MSKDDIMKLPLTLENLTKCLQNAFMKIEDLKNKRLIIAIGNTGCGKSTLLNSLIHGSQCLHET